MASRRYYGRVRYPLERNYRGGQKIRPMYNANYDLMENEYARLRRERHKRMSGEAWVVQDDGDTATVRVPKKGGGLQNLTFTFQQTDDFLQKIDAMPMPETFILNYLVLVMPHNKIKEQRGDQGVPRFVDPKQAAKLMHVDYLDYLRAMTIAASEIAGHFRGRYSNRKGIKKVGKRGNLHGRDAQSLI